MVENPSGRHSMNVLACVSVALLVFAQCIGKVYPISSYGAVETIEPLVYLFRTVLLTIAYMGAPIGFILLGARLLSKDYESPEDLLAFYKKPFLKVLAAVEAWIVITAIVNFFYESGNEFQTSELLRQMTFISRPLNMPQSWVLYAILILFIAAPFIAVIVKRFTFRALSLPFFFALVTSMLIPFLGQVGLVYAGNAETYSVALPLSASGGYLCVYLVLGYYIDHKKELRDFPAFLLIVMFLISFVPNILLQTQALSREAFFPLWYTSPLLLISVMAAYELIRRAAERPAREGVQRAFSTLASLSAGVLLTNHLILTPLNSALSKLSLRYPLRLAILFILTLAASYALSFLIGKLGKAGKALLLIERL